MQKVTIRKTKLYTTILRKNSKIVVAHTALGLIELGEFPIDVEVKVQKVSFDPSLYGEDMLYQIKKALFKKQIKGWIPATCGKTLLSIMTNKNFRIDDKYQLVVFARPAVKGGQHE
jgi:hypothetical protein